MKTMLLNANALEVPIVIFIAMIIAIRPKGVRVQGIMTMKITGV